MIGKNGYIITDVFKEISQSVKSVLGLSTLNYQFGYVDELNQTLKQFEEGGADQAILKFPCIWLFQPFTIKRNSDYPDSYFFGELQDGRIFIMEQTDVNLKAYQRMEQKFKPTIYPIYYELIKQILKHPAFFRTQGVNHKVIDRYYWGKEQQTYLNDKIDCLEISNMVLNVNYVEECVLT